MLNELRVGELLDALGERTPTPASGAATAVTAALAAALTELAARFAGNDTAAASAKAAAARLMALADEDAAAYTDFMAERSDAARARIIEVPREIAACAADVAVLAAAVRTQLTSSVAGDAEVAVELAQSAARAASRLVELNGG